MKMNLKVAIFMGAAFLCGCDSEDIETANFGSDYLLSRYDFINLAPNEVHFHMRNSEINGDARNAESEDYRKAIVAAGEQVRGISHELNTGRRLTLYAVAPYEVNQWQSLHTKHEREERYNVIAWLNGNALKLVSYKKANSDKADVMRIRLFATESVTVRIKSQTVTLQEGQQSDYYDISDCDGDIVVNDSVVTICEAAFGASYLLALYRDEKLGLYRQ